MRLLLLVLLLAAASLAPRAAALTCDPGYYLWEREGLEHCRQCPPGCACPGGLGVCVGCSGGFFTDAAGAAACVACAPGTTTDPYFNSGCDPMNYETPCANFYGPLGHVACRPDPPPPNATVGYLNPHLPSGALYAPPQYEPGGPPYVPNVIPPYYDIDGRPMVQQSY